MNDQISNEEIEIESPLENEEATAEPRMAESDDNNKYKEGELLRFIRVRFPGHVNSQEFFIGTRNFNYGQKVVAMSDRGMAVGYINSLIYEKPFHSSLLPLKKISRVAEEKDLEQEAIQHRKRKDAENTFVELASKHKLDMTLTHVEFTQFGKNIVFYFNANNRVDFRGLLVDLRREFKLRIELRQISIRDRSAAMGGVGSCGRALCCSSFLKELGGTNIKMCKNQDLAIIPSKINGVCGQIKCCMRYENDTYVEKREKLPEEGTFLQTHNADRGKVTKLHVIREQFEMITDQGKIRRYALDQYDINRKLPENWSFPRELDVIYDERAQLVTQVEEPSPQPSELASQGNDQQVNSDLLSEGEQPDLSTNSTPREPHSNERGQEQQRNGNHKRNHHRSRNNHNRNNNGGNRGPSNNNAS